MAKHNSKKKIDALSGILYSSNDKSKVRVRFFNDLTPEQILQNIGRLKNHRFFSEIINIDVLDLSEIYTKSTPKTSFLKSLYWHIGVLEINSDKINRYLEYSRLITQNILNSNYEAAISLLDACDNEVGVSIASLSQRGAILALNNDNDSINKLSTRIAKSKSNAFFSAIANDVINRYEDSSVFISDAISFRNQILRQFQGELLNFLLYRLTLKEPLGSLDFDPILNLEKNSTVIDMYLAVITFIETNFTRLKDKRDNVKYVVQRLHDKISTPLLKNLSYMFNISNQYAYSGKDNDYIDQYTKGNYQQVIDTFVNDSYYMTDFQYMEIAAKAAARVSIPNINGMKGKILSSMVNLLTKDDDYETSLSFLLCLCHCFSSLEWFSQLRVFVENEAKELNEKQKKQVRELSILHSDISTPRKLDILTGPSSQKYVDEYRSNVGETLTMSLWANKGKILELPPEILSQIESGRYKRYLAFYYLENKNYIDAISVLEGLASGKDILQKYEASKMLIDLYLDLDDFDKAAEEFVNECLINKNLIPFYNSAKICELLKSNISQSQSICIPIAFSLHSRFVNDKYNSALRYAFENILITNKIDLPLDNNKLYERYPEELVDYFLEYVCTPDVMRLYLFFENTKQIENCRIEICNHLIAKNQHNEYLVHEVKERTKKLVITDAAKHVENSRIFSDTSIFYAENTAENITNLYNKYLSLTSNDYSKFQDEQTLLDLYKKFKDSAYIHHMHSVHLLDMPLNEKNKCFLSLIRMMRDIFCYGDKGLNNYLSTRIRHGHLPTTLRKSVLDENLVTKRLAKSQAFKKNDYWIERLGKGHEKDEKRLDKIFTDFSNEYDKVVNEINNKWIQIFVLDKNISLLSDQQSRAEGLFNYSISNLESYTLQQRIPIKTEYSEFVKHVVNWLWSRTDINLKEIRGKIDKEARTRLTDLLIKLQKDINDVCDISVVADFNNSVGKARTSLSTNIEHIISWFERSDESSIDNYDIETAIEIARRSLNVNVNITIDRDYDLKGHTLTNIVDCLYIFFENAISKSNISKDDLALSIDIIGNEGEVKVTITNMCQAVSDLEEANKSLDIYRNSYGQSNVELSKLQKEGGTGFFKIWNILHNGVGLVHRLTFGYADINTFFVELSLYNFNRVLNHENTNC